MSRVLRQGCRSLKTDAKKINVIGTLNIPTAIFQIKTTTYE